MPHGRDRSRPLVEAIEQPVHLQIGQPADVGQRAGELGDAVADRRQASDDAHAAIGQRVEVDRPVLGRPDQLRRRQVAGADEIVHLVVALAEHTGRLHPPAHVATAVRPRQPDVLADGEGHRSPGAPDLVGQLHAGGRRADDEHAALVEVVR